jgi:arginyl-tRNA synthetase
MHEVTEKICHHFRLHDAMADIEHLVKKADKAEKEVEQLFKELEQLQSRAKGVQEDQAVPEELEKLRVENSKLNYRLGILKRATEKASKSKGNKMESVLQTLVDHFSVAVSSAFPDLPEAPVPVTQSAKQGDYQFNGAMVIAGKLKAQGIKTPPRDVALKIESNLPSSASDIIEKTEVAGPGFINIFVKKSFFEKGINEMLEKGIRSPAVPGGRRRVIVDYSAPNIAKEMHVGHLRSTIIGKCIIRSFMVHILS